MSGRTNRAPVTIAPRYLKPRIFSGTDIQWRALCELYPNAETPEVIMAVIEYCAVRRLDPYRKPVHVVPMYNSRLRRRVQVVMQGINEIETTAARTGQWAGMDEPVFGPDQTHTFHGAPGTTDEDGEAAPPPEVTLTFPASCSITVYRLVAGTKQRFVGEPVYWMEAYGRAGFRSEMPNERWRKASRQMLIKVAKAAALRAVFPEASLGYAAEEMEGREIDGGVVLDGEIDPPPPPSHPHQEPAKASLAVLDSTDPDAFLKGLYGLLGAATTPAEIASIEEHPNVQAARQDAPTLIRSRIEDEIHAARMRAGEG